MTPELEKVQTVMLKYAKLYAATYAAPWSPRNEHIAQTLELFKSPMPGFEGLTPEELCGRLEVFFRTKEDWLVSSRHNYSNFTKHVHRWVNQRPKSEVGSPKADPSTALSVTSCDEHPDQKLQDGQLCPLCYPVCEKCGVTHYKDVSCETQKEIDDRLSSILGSPDKRAGATDREKKPQTIGAIIGEKK